MLKTGRHFAVLCWLACSAGQPGVRASDPAREATLSARAATAYFAAALQSAPALLELDVLRIQNSAGQSFMLRAEATWSDAAGQSAGIGSVSPYPSDRPGRFQLEVPLAARKGLQMADSRLRVMLAPIAAGQALSEQLEVTIAAPAWRY